MAEALVHQIPSAERPPDRTTVPNGPRFRSPFGMLAAFRADPLGFLERCQRDYGDVVEIRFWPFRTYIFTRPEHIKHILHDNHHNYWKGLVVQKVKRIGGEGLIFSDGDLWRRQRQLIQPAFHRERIAALAQMMIDTTANVLDRWQIHARSGRPLDVMEERSRLTLEIVAKALFGTDLGAAKDELIGAVAAAMIYGNHLINHFFTPPLWVPTRVNREGRRAIARLDAVINTIIAARRREPAGHDDLLSMLISARDGATDGVMDDRQLRDEMVTFLVAGHETTAVALSWTWHLLAQNAPVEARLHAEIATVSGRNAHAFAHLPYVHMTLEESMRLYPPAWGIARQSYEEDWIGGVRIPPRTTVSLSPYLTHRHPALWEHPERFDPERFTPEANATRPEYAYFPFGAGPRGCVGRQFAMMEGQIVLAMIAERFRLRPIAGHRVEPDPIFTLRPRGGMPMTVHTR